MSGMYEVSVVEVTLRRFTVGDARVGITIIGLFERGYKLLVIWLSGSFGIYITVKISLLDRIQSARYVTE